MLKCFVMYVFGSDEIKAWENYTIDNEPISSINLMERAAQNFVGWFTKHFFDTNKPVVVFCGTGNNGGDGLAIARMLSKKFYTVHVYICNISANKTKDFLENLERVKLRDVASINELSSNDKFPELSSKCILIDALLGIGFNKSIDDKWKGLFANINNLNQPKIAIDIPSGLPNDGYGNEETIQANYTITFQVPKPAFFYPENEKYLGNWLVIPIGLDERFLNDKVYTFNYLQFQDIQNLLLNRAKFSHKGTYGHALMVVGQQGMMGAAVLSTKAAYRTGAGIVTAHIPNFGETILQTAIPEAILNLDSETSFISTSFVQDKYSVVGIGCGIGTKSNTKNMVKKYIESYKNVVVDADGLNCVAELGINNIQFPENAIITPHPKEFSRLFSETHTSKDRIKLAFEKAVELKIIIILKGANTAIFLPNGSIYFNSTGNAGMATAGSGDVLTGILAGLISRGYQPSQAALLGVYLHGLAGDIAKETLGMESLIASDIIDYIPNAFKKLYL